MAVKLFDGTRVVSSWTIDGTEFTFHRCGECGIVWGMPDWFLEERKKDGHSWLCPNGHSFHFTGPTLEQQLASAKKRLRAEQEYSASVIARLDQANASRAALKGQVTKAKKKLARVEAGVCPDCNRTFQNLARHMKTKHGHH